MGAVELRRAMCVGPADWDNACSCLLSLVRGDDTLNAWSYFTAILGLVDSVCSHEVVGVQPQTVLLCLPLWAWTSGAVDALNDMLFVGGHVLHVM